MLVNKTCFLALVTVNTRSTCCVVLHKSIWRTVFTNRDYNSTQSTVRHAYARKMLIPAYIIPLRSWPLIPSLMCSSAGMSYNACLVKNPSNSFQDIVSTTFWVYRIRLFQIRPEVDMAGGFRNSNLAEPDLWRTRFWIRQQYVGWN